MSDKPHVYFSGFGRMSDPDEPRYPCCDVDRNDPIHIHRAPDPICCCQIGYECIDCGRRRILSRDNPPVDPNEGVDEFARDSLGEWARDLRADDA